MKGEFHAPELDPEFFPGHVTDDGEVVDLLFADFANGWFALDRIMLVRLFMAAITTVDVSETGILSLDFSDGHRLVVTPDREFESWSLSGSGVRQMQVGPSGG